VPSTFSGWTLADWLSINHPMAMLNGLSPQDQVSPRKYRLFACACCRRIWHLLQNDHLQQAICLAEAHAERQASWEALRAARRAVRDDGIDLGNTPPAVWFSVLASVWNATHENAARGAIYGSEAVARVVAHDCPEGLEGDASLRNSRAALVPLLEDLFANYFHQVAVNPAWLTWNEGAVCKLAQGIYDERAFDRLPILADALEDAGCDNADLLAHCRSGREHVRGCWVVDLLLGKE
jgi:hypothetical protein